jgi:hypothetical protein
VMVDPMRCEEWPPLDSSKQSQIDRGVRLTAYAIPIARLMVTSLLPFQNAPSYCRPRSGLR